MALDGPKENDEVFTQRGVTFLIEKTLFERAKPISIDYVLNAMGGGYILKSELLKLSGVECECEDISETCYPHC
jgi:Fe-S cluster assembly iron-binding protein IscA